MPRIFAAADIGSNTAHLLVGEVSGNSIKRLYNESVWLSLGEVVSRHGHIPSPQAELLIETLRKFRWESQKLGAQSLQVFATEAMRLASNQAVLLTRIRDSAGVEVEMISAMREAQLSYTGTLVEGALRSPGVRKGAYSMNTASPSVPGDSLLGTELNNLVRILE